MRGKVFACIFAVFLAFLVVLSPICSFFVFYADDLYDSVFTPSLGNQPVVRAGRVMPISSASNDVLKSISGKSTAKIDTQKVSSTKWLWSINAKPMTALNEKFLRTDNRDLQKLLNADSRNYSYNSFLDNYNALYNATLGKEQSVYKDSVISAINAGMQYSTAVNSLGYRFSEDKSAGDSINNWRSAVENATKEFEDAQSQNRAPDTLKLKLASAYLSRLQREADNENANTTIRTIPTESAFESSTVAMLDRDLSQQGNDILGYYIQLRDAIADDNRPLAFEILKKLDAELVKVDGIDIFKVRFENFINALNPFFGGFILYGLAMMFFALSILFKVDNFKSIANILLIVAVGEHIFGIVARTYIQMRPPVTNLYSTVVFTGAIAALMGLLMSSKKEKLFLGISSAMVGFLSLLVAINLPYSGDTMGMMRAVLNSNFWLTVHVITIMLGYCGVFLAGFLAYFRLIANLFSKGNFGILTGDVAKSVYAILCFSLLFSFAGTMLGGIWADMSWGRFWGWDPKENGALMVVLWTAATIHAKALRLVADRVFLAFAVIGNIVTAWAWFGVNLLGVGLHSYGFVDGGWFWLFAFVATQLIVLPIALKKHKVSVD